VSAPTSTRPPLRPISAEPEPPAPSWAARLPELAFSAAWRHRWRLAPLYLAAGTAVGATTTPLWTAGGLTAAGAAMEIAGRTGVTAPGGRMLLSHRERRIAAVGLGAAAAWTAQAGLTGGLLPWWLDAGMLLSSLGLPARAWWASRRPEPPPPSLLSPLAAHVLEGWAGEITIGSGPRALRGSWPVEGSLLEPADGALAMTVQLAHGMHATKAASAETRRDVEALLGMPVDTVALETVRDNSTQVRVLFTPSRHLERAGGVDWPGPHLGEDGQMPLAECPDGAGVGIPLFDTDGVRHGFVSGTSGSGKSVSSVSVMLPGLAAGIEVCLLVDGKRGTSTPYLRAVVSRYARMPRQWQILIEIAYRVMVDRQDRRGAAGLHEWHSWDEPDPILTLIMDDVTAINRVISSKHVGMVCEMLEHGRAVGVRVIQITQSPSFEDIIGGVQARNLMTSAGWAICHRAGGSGASRLTLDSASGVDVDLRGLPNGQAAVLVAGKLAGFPAQVRNATKDRVLEVLPTITPRHLTGADLAAAGPAYTAAHWNDCWTPGYTFDPGRQADPARQTAVPAQTKHPTPAGGLTMAHEWVLNLLGDRGPMSQAQLAEQIPAASQALPSVLDELTKRELVAPSADGTFRLLPAAAHHPGPPDPDPPQPAAEDLPTSRRWVLDQLRRHGPMALKDLQALGDDDPAAPKRRTISDALTDLMQRHQVTKAGATWALAESAGLDPGGDELDH
jgi:hypothetical protein